VPRRVLVGHHRKALGDQPHEMSLADLHDIGARSPAATFFARLRW
jgi:hypothetical protein